MVHLMDRVEETVADGLDPHPTGTGRADDEVAAARVAVQVVGLGVVQAVAQETVQAVDRTADRTAAVAIDEMVVS